MNYAANQPLLSVIIVNWNTRELIAACLASVAAEAAALAQSIIGPGIGPGLIAGGDGPLGRAWLLRSPAAPAGG